MSRIIGIVHRIKRTAEGEARPTQVAVNNDGRTATYPLATETDELDWVKGKFPTKFRKIRPDEDPANFTPHQVKWRKLGEEGMPENFPPDHLVIIGGSQLVADKVPDLFDGLQAGDRVAMILGGSGDRLAAALSRRGENIDAKVFRLPPHILKERRGNAKKDEDHFLLTRLLGEEPELFYPVDRKERALIRLQETFRARQEIMMERIACEQRQFQRLIGGIFLREDGLFPEGRIEDAFDAAKANDTILRVLTEEEKQRDSELAKAVKELDVWNQVFTQIKGVGPRIAAGIIVPIRDIRRFATPAKLKAFAGVNVGPEGEFRRKRVGQKCNWNPTLRQTLYLLADQFNRRLDSVWGVKFLENKRRLREKHPEVEIGENGKKRFSNAHIHKMAAWRTLTKFVEWLWKEWWRLERSRQQ